MTDERPPRTIRMFPDYAGTVLWISMPIEYEDTGLSGGLVAELVDWEEFYYDSLDSDFNWVPESAARTFTEEGVRLARLVAAEVGPQFEVEFSSYEDGAETVHIRAEHPAQNPAAEAAFARLFDEDEAEWREAQERRKNNPDGEWIAYAPLSGAVLDLSPNNQTETESDER
ncbi:hypothetical protein BI49514_02323 [Brevibacterium iodinum ATCC 49514]|uniref:Uncharacterized protein n=2 Tax=Brevibacterium iodinum TaxID=31943 RepID=A0A2H1JSY8_9MICO|nr:hypothetical protein BI49514_02323 [Brevibacterium iodinum ATCC 49514]SUW12433.1 Uncharacterised protein [Brevibacterium iodinum]